MAPGSPAPTLDQPYDPAKVEPRWYSFWESHGVFAASDDPTDTRPVYVVPMPPPNVTGSLHMGHALFTTLQDVLVRWHRMRGYNVLWQPGTDHAGIATQTVVERGLAREGKSRHDIGREAFVERVWQWRRETGDRIHQQQRELGASPDWSRSKFTMDADMSRAVTEAFVRLYEQGLMYRATRLINWCPECRTALSDLEVDNEEGANGELFEFAYEVEGGASAASPEGDPQWIVVATTRPETMLGDTAVAVHPDDPRYTALHGKRVKHPFVDRTFPIITDAVLVDPKFGTGAVKVTPAHDFNDFATGKRHGLEEINILNLDGTLNAAAGRFAGMDRKEARRAVKRALEEKGLARGSKPHTLTLPRCQRSGGVVEPMISTQWFLKMSGMAEKALEAVRSGKTVILPGEWTKTYDHVLGNIQDWCVSRQLWWGHAIPAWHGPDGRIVVARERPKDLGADGTEWVEDPDVLDTWFSSSLWPFSAIGWPEETHALAKFYPASDLETGYDILFFWVARMMMFGLHVMGEVPFRRVLLHGLVVDETGDKMSKMKGNVIDPLDLVRGASFEKMVPDAETMARFKKAYPSAAAMGSGFPAFGADAVRFTLATYPPSNKRIALAPKRIEGNRHFLNKIWNATRLALDLLGDYDAAKASGAPPEGLHEPVGPLSLRGGSGDRQRRHRRVPHRRGGARGLPVLLGRALRLVPGAGEARPAGGATRRHIPSPGARRRDAGDARITCSKAGSLRLGCTRIMPFITEELWQRIPRKDYGRKIETNALAPYPTAASEGGSRDADVDAQMETLQAVISAARTVRSEHEIHHTAEIPVRIPVGRRARCSAFLRGHVGAIRVLVKTAGEPHFEAPGGPRELGTTVSVVPSSHGPIEVLVGLKGLVDPGKERARIERELKRIEKDLGALEKKLASPGFVDRAPPEVVEEAKQQRKALLEAKERLEHARKLAEEL